VIRSAFLFLFLALPLHADGWPQFGRDAAHSGRVAQGAQPLQHIFANVVYDPFAPIEEASADGELLVHYQVPLVDGDDVFMEFKSGTFGNPTWSIHRLHWENGTLADKWTAPSDWKPLPTEWEPLFHAILANGFVYVPGAGGTMLQFDRSNGSLVRRINPFGSLDPTIYVAGAPAGDANGNLYYTAMRINTADPWLADVRGAWLVRVAPDGSTTLASFTALVPSAPMATAQCTGIFDLSQSPLPPSPNATPPSVQCGSQRPGVNAAPAIAGDGTIYVVSRAHFNSYWSYLVAVNPDLTPKWAASLRNRFHDGCNILLPPNGTPGGCRSGTQTGFAPEENAPGSGRVIDISTSSPVVAPDGSVLYGAYTIYNDIQGHLMHFAADGAYLGAYQFGWDITPAIYEHDGTYSIALKENHYGGAVHPVPAYFMTQLSPSFAVEWQAEADDEWCVNAPAVDAGGTVYANSEDGYLYAIAQGGAIRQRIFLQRALGAAYTPVSIGPEGRIYAQNAGHLFVIGGTAHPRAARH
jgi:outer membrane protein assembly factor BamB